MAIKTENAGKFIDGDDLIRTFSDAGKYIERDGVIYAEAIDPAKYDRKYTETDTDLPKNKEERDSND